MLVAVPEPATRPLWVSRLIGVGLTAAGIGGLLAGMWLFGWLGWSARLLFFAGGIGAGGGLAMALVPASASAVLDERPSAGGTRAGRLIARLCLGVGVVVGVGAWLTH